jgi:integrase
MKNTQKDINGALSVMLHGLSLKTPAGEPVKVTSHLLRHSFATEMRTLNTPLDVLALMKQKMSTLRNIMPGIRPPNWSSCNSNFHSAA